MKKFHVLMRAIVTKRFIVEAETENEARTQAHAKFDTSYDPTDPESYNEHIIDIREAAGPSPIGQPCSVPDCDHFAVVMAPISINGAPKKWLPVCQIHADSAREGRL